MRYFVLDHLGSIAVVTDENGNVVERDFYDPWGKRRNADGSDDTTCSLTSQTTHGFTNQEEIDALCLVNLNAKIYDPTLGKFMSPDSFVPDPFDGQSFNRYTYVGNNPLSMVDPTGHMEVVQVLGTQPISTCPAYLICYSEPPSWWNGGVVTDGGAGGGGGGSVTVQITSGCTGSWCGTEKVVVTGHKTSTNDSRSRSPIATGYWNTWGWQNVIIAAPGGSGIAGGGGSGTDTNGAWYGPTSTFVGGAGVLSDVTRFSAGSATLGINLNNILRSKIYAKGWGGNQSVWAGRIGAGAELTGKGLLGLSVGLDVYGYFTGQISGSKLGVDLTVDAVGAAGGLAGAGFAGAYYGLETFYPGGAAGALNDYGKNVQQNQAINPNYTPMDPGKISFHPKKRSPDAVPNHKKPKKRDDVIDPYDLPMDPGKI